MSSVRLKDLVIVAQLRDRYGKDKLLSIIDALSDIKDSTKVNIKEDSQ